MVVGINNKPHGFGVVTFVDGTKYEGNFIDGVSKGVGITITGVGSSLVVNKTREYEQGQDRLFSNFDTFNEVKNLLQDRKSSV